jgi:hypothetical protein
MKFCLFLISFLSILIEFVLMENVSNPQINLVFEHSYTCGYSFLQNKKKINDIVDEIKKRRFEVKFKVRSHKLQMHDNMKNRNFNIYLLNGNNNEILIATSEVGNKKYYPILSNYPKSFINKNFMNVAISDTDILVRKDFIDSILKEFITTQKEL